VIFTLEATKRTIGKKSELNNLRREGLIPAVLYGKNMDSTPITVKKGEFQQCYKKSFNELAFYEIVLEGKKHHTILKDKLVHPVTRNILHIDFMVVESSAQMEFEIPIKIIGEPAGIKEGGFMDIIQRTVKISCRAKDIPEELPLDVSGLNIGDSLHIKDLPEGKWQYKDHADATLVVVHAKKAEAEPTAPAASTEATETKPE
jgi:large subunit ribosomal protein L25